MVAGIGQDWTLANGYIKLYPSGRYVHSAIDARFMGIVHHTDAQRGYAYDRKSHIGKLDKALDEGTAKGWTIVDMKRDWRRVFAFEPLN